jgi:hypothetical protein
MGDVVTLFIMVFLIASLSRISYTEGYEDGLEEGIYRGRGSR